MPTVKVIVPPVLTRPGAKVKVKASIKGAPLPTAKRKKPTGA